MWFFATCSLTNSGLVVTNPEDIKSETFFTSGVLMFIGSSVFLLLPTIGFRIYKLRQLKPIMENCLANIEEKRRQINQSMESEQNGISFTASVLSQRLVSTKGVCNLRRGREYDDDALYIKQYLSLYYGSIATFITVVIYLLTWAFLGSIILSFCLMGEDMEPTLHEQGYNYYQNALYLTISALSNSGFTISKNSFSYMNTNAGKFHCEFLYYYFIFDISIRFMCTFECFSCLDSNKFNFVGGECFVASVLEVVSSSWTIFMQKVQF